MAATHRYETVTTWAGNLGTGTSGYRAYSRDHHISTPVKSAPILASSDPAFRGDRTRYNPEELLVGALSACHMLWVLHLCAEAGITVTEYVDIAEGVLTENADGSGQFTEVVLRPRVTILEPDRVDAALAIHEKAHSLCFIARSVNFGVRHEPLVSVGA